MISKESILEKFNTNIEAREQEVFDYQFNIAQFEAMIARLPVAGPRPADALEAAKHDLRDDLVKRIVNERVQLQTAQLVLDVLIARRDAA